MHRCWFCRAEFKTFGRLVFHHRSHTRQANWRELLGSDEEQKEVA